MTNLLQCTVDDGKLHISYEGRSLGSIDSYNNFVTQGAAAMYNWSASVVINGKTRYLDRADYAKWINKYTLQTAVTESNVDQFKEFRFLKLKPVAQDAPTAASCLSAYKSEKLTRKLIMSMYEDKLEKAKKCVLQGAKLDRVFWTRGKLGLCFADPMKDFESKATDIEIRSYTPLLFAGEKKDYSLCEYMKQLGANQEAVGTVTRFTRSIVDHRESSNLEFVPTYKFDKDHKLRTDMHLGTRHTTALLFEDAETKQAELVFKPVGSPDEKNVTVERPLAKTETTKRQFEVPMTDVRVDHGRLWGSS